MSSSALLGIYLALLAKDRTGSSIHDTLLRVAVTGYFNDLLLGRALELSDRVIERALELVNGLALWVWPCVASDEAVHVRRQQINLGLGPDRTTLNILASRLRPTARRSAQPRGRPSDSVSGSAVP